MLEEIERRISQEVWDFEYANNYPYLDAKYEEEYKRLWLKSWVGRLCVLSACIKSLFLAGKIKGVQSD